MTGERRGVLKKGDVILGVGGNRFLYDPRTEFKPLLPAIHRAIMEPAPSGIMFADGIRLSGLGLLAAKKKQTENNQQLLDRIERLYFCLTKTTHFYRD